MSSILHFYSTIWAWYVVMYWVWCLVHFYAFLCIICQFVKSCSVTYMSFIVGFFPCMGISFGQWNIAIRTVIRLWVCVELLFFAWATGKTWYSLWLIPHIRTYLLVYQHGNWDENSIKWNTHLIRRRWRKKKNFLTTWPINLELLWQNFHGQSCFVSYYDKIFMPAVVSYWHGDMLWKK